MSLNEVNEMDWRNCRNDCRWLEYDCKELSIKFHRIKALERMERREGCTADKVQILKNSFPFPFHLIGFNCSCIFLFKFFFFCLKFYG